MPFPRVHGIVIDPLRRAEALSAIGAAREHHVCAVATERSHAGYHVNVVACRPAGAINCQEHLSTKAVGIYRAAINDAAAHVDCGELVKSRRDIRVPRVSRSNAPKNAAGIATADVEVAVGGHVERPPLGRVGNVDRGLPAHAAVGGPAEFAAVTTEQAGPKLVLEAVPHAGGRPVGGEPFLVTSVGASVG